MPPKFGTSSSIGTSSTRSQGGQAQDSKGPPAPVHLSGPEILEEEGPAEQVYARDLGKTLERYAARVAAVLKSHTDNQFSELEREKKMLHDHGAQSVEEHRKQAMVSWKGYENFKVAANDQKTQLHLLRTRELDRQLGWHNDLLDAERNWVQDASSRFDNALQNFSQNQVDKFDAEAKKHNDLLDHQMAERMAETEQQAKLKKDKKFNEVVVDSEKKAVTHFDSHVADSRKQWLVTQKRLLLQVEEELRNAHEHGIQMLERHAKAGENFGKGAQSRWKVRLRKSRTSLQRLAEAYETVLRRAYEDQVKELRSHIEEQAQFYKQKLKQVHDEWTSERETLEAQLRKMRIALVKWRHDYATDAEQKSAVSVKQAAERAVQDRAAAKAKEENQDPALQQSNINPDSLDLKSGDADGVQKLIQKRETLQRLWRGLEVSEEDVKSFYRKLERAVPYTHDSLVVYDSHLARYGRHLNPDGTGGAGQMGPCQRIALQQHVDNK